MYFYGNSTRSFPMAYPTIRPGPQSLRRPHHPARQGLPPEKRQAFAVPNALESRPATGLNPPALWLLLRGRAGHSHGLFSPKGKPGPQRVPRQRDHPQPLGQQRPQKARRPLYLRPRGGPPSLRGGPERRRHRADPGLRHHGADRGIAPPKRHRHRVRGIPGKLRYHPAPLCPRCGSAARI